MTVLNFADEISEHHFNYIQKHGPIRNHLSLYYSVWDYPIHIDFDIVAFGYYYTGCGFQAMWIISVEKIPGAKLQIEIPTLTKYLWCYIPLDNIVYTDKQLKNISKQGGIIVNNSNIFFFTNNIQCPNINIKSNKMMAVLHNKAYTYKWNNNPLYIRYID